MKYKLLGLTACMLSIVIAVLAPLTVSGHALKDRVHQHREGVPETACEHEEDVLCTYLPIVEINTGGQTIPGRPVKDSEEKYTLSEDGETYITADIRIIGRDSSEYHHTYDAPDVESAVRIRVRGNSSRSFEKPSYALKLVDDKGKNNFCEIMGMDAHSDWVLYGPWLDKTAIRNYMFYNLSGEIMDYAPNVRYCEVIVDGDYQGLYLMTEKITAGTDGSRLDLKVNAKGNTYTGYLLRLDHRKADEQPLNTFTDYTYIQEPELMLQLEFPGEKNRSSEMEEEIRRDFSEFEKSLYSYDYNDKKYGYKARTDMDDFIDYFIINEITGNLDAGNFSTYIYKNADGRLRLCVWDFNNACDNYFDGEQGYRGLFMPWRQWFWMMVKDEDFTDRTIYRYRELIKGVLSEGNMDAYIDETLKFIEPALERNDERWGSVSEQASKLLKPESRNIESRDEAEGQLKGYLHNRGEWLDENIETLRQFSAPSRTKKFNEVND